MIRLGINITPLAMMRQNRVTTQPDPVTAIVITEIAGAGSIVVPLSEDSRFLGK
ncbi:pyridoxine 5'-phosphate synthase [bacterium]|nr:pyridoxine 5'-phosphate synthase [bacterium]